MSSTSNSLEKTKRIKIHEMYKELRPYYSKVIDYEGLQFFVIYDEKTKELEILNEFQIEDTSRKISEYVTIHEGITLADLFNKINHYVDEIEEYLLTVTK